MNNNNPFNLVGMLFPNIGKLGNAAMHASNVATNKFNPTGDIEQLKKNTKNFQTSSTRNMHDALDRIKQGDFFSSKRVEQTIQDGLLGGSSNMDFDLEGLENLSTNKNGKDDDLFDMGDDLFFKDSKTTSNDNKEYQKFIKQTKNEQNTTINNTNYSNVTIDTTKVEQAIFKQGLSQSKTIQDGTLAILKSKEISAKMTKDFRQNTLEYMEVINRSVTRMLQSSKKTNMRTGGTRPNSILDLMTGDKSLAQFTKEEMLRMKGQFSGGGMMGSMARSALEKGDPMSVILQLMAGQGIEKIDNRFLGGKIGGLNRTLSQFKPRAVAGAGKVIGGLFEGGEGKEKVADGIEKIPLFGKFFKDKLNGLDKNSRSYNVYKRLFGLDEESNNPTEAKFRDPSTQVPFDAETHTSINKVIPGYLRKMLSLVSGQEELFHDYRSGKWMAGNEVRNTFTTDVKRNLANHDTFGMVSQNKELQRLLSEGKLTQEQIGDNLYKIAKNKVATNEDFEKMSKELDPQFADAIRSDKSGGAVGLQSISTLRKYLMGRTDPNNPDERHSYIGNMTDALGDVFSKNQIETATKTSATKSPLDVYNRIEKNLDIYGEIVDIVGEIKDYLKTTDNIAKNDIDKDNKPQGPQDVRKNNSEYTHTSESNSGTNHHINDNQKRNEQIAKNSSSSNSPQDVPATQQQEQQDSDDQSLDKLKEKYKATKSKFETYKSDTRGMSNKEKFNYLKDKAKGRLTGKINEGKDLFKGKVSDIRKDVSEFKTAGKGMGGALKEAKGAGSTLDLIKNLSSKGLGAGGLGSILGGLTGSGASIAGAAAGKGAGIVGEASRMPSAFGGLGKIFGGLGEAAPSLAGAGSAALPSLAKGAGGLGEAASGLGKFGSIAGRAGGLLSRVLPGIGTIAGGVGAISDLSQGNVGGALLNGLSMIPGIGLIAGGARMLGADKLVNSALSPVLHPIKTLQKVGNFFTGGLFGGGDSDSSGGDPQQGNLLAQAGKFAFNASPLGMLANSGSFLLKKLTGLGLQGNPLQNPESLAKLGFSLSPIGMMFGIGDQMSAKFNFFGKFFKKFNTALLKLFKNSTDTASASTTSGSSSGGDSKKPSDIGNLSGNSNAEKVWKGLTKEGFNDYATAGILGNMYGESGVNPDAGEVGGGGGYGLVQWTPKSKLDAYAKSVNKDSSKLETQVEYLCAQLKGTTDIFPDTAAYKPLMAAKSTDEAVEDFLTYYERPAAWAAAQSMPKRKDAAKKYYDEFHGKTSSDSKDSSSSSKGNAASTSSDSGKTTNGGGSSSGGGQPNGGDSKTVVGNSATLFPKDTGGVIITDIRHDAGGDHLSANGGHDGWDIVPLNNAHGVRLNSISSGTVIQMSQHGLMPFITIKSGDKVLQYQEFADNSIPGNLHVGSSVNAGDEIGRMGMFTSTGGAYTTGEHLHLSYHKYKEDKTTYYAWSPQDFDIDPGQLWSGTKSGKTQAGQRFTWEQLGSPTLSGGSSASKSDGNSAGDSEANDDPFKDQWLNETNDEKKADISRIEQNLSKRYDPERKALEAAQKAQAAGASDEEVKKAVQQAMQDAIAQQGNGGQGKDRNNNPNSNNSSNSSSSNNAIPDGNNTGQGGKPQPGQPGYVGKDGKDGITTVLYRGITGDEVKNVKRIRENTDSIHDTLKEIYAALEGTDNAEEADVLGQIIKVLTSGNKITKSQLDILNKIFGKLPVENPFSFNTGLVEPILQGF